ncbi:MAG: class I SAM-dependent methyltransferase, partial [Patescibacteria group bacterium]
MQLHASWESIIEPLIKACDPHIVVEIGTGTAALTRKLLTFCSERGAILHSVDPEPDCDIEELTKQYGSTFIFHRDFSFSVLSKIGSCDVVFIDGDHNWYTVYNELKILELSCHNPADFPLVILHDTGWPYGFRDTYIDPERIPPPFLQPYKKGGVHPDSGLLSDKGINTDFYHAIYEGNPHNGVSAAVKDFVKESELELVPIFLPGGHGLGILTSSQRLKKNSVLSSQFENLRLSPILNTHIDAIEHNRIRILLDLQYIQQIAETRHQELSQLRCEQYDLTITAEQLRNSNINLSAANEQLRTEKMREQQRKEEAEKMREEEQQKRKVEHRLREEAERMIVEEQREKEEEKRLKDKAVRSLVEKEQLIKRITQSLSWRCTEPLRRGEAALRLLFKPRVLVNHLAYITIGILHDIWTDFGEPCPRLTRFIRHRLLKRWPPRSSLPAPHPQQSTQHPLHSPPKATITETIETAPIAVVVDAREPELLTRTIMSLLTQRPRPQDILILSPQTDGKVDHAIAPFLKNGVRMQKGMWKVVPEMFFAGFSQTIGRYFAYLTAEEHWHPTFLAAAIQILENKEDTGFVYGDTRLYGERTDLIDRSKEPSTVEGTGEFLSPGAVVFRREALMQIHPTEEDDIRSIVHRMQSLGWRGVHSEGLHFLHTIKGGAMGSSLVSNTFQSVEATLCLALSGREWAWPLTRAFLERQQFPHDKLHLIILDTSQEPLFSHQVRVWLGSCDYKSHTYLAEDVG